MDHEPAYRVMQQLRGRAAHSGGCLSIEKTTFAGWILVRDLVRHLVSTGNRRFYFRRSSSSARDWASYSCQVTPERGRLFAAREELKQITTESERDGGLTATERAMIHSVVDFRGSKVRDVMLPSAKVAALRSGASTQEALELSASTGLDRLPVLAPDGQPAGLVNVLDILLERNGNKPLGEIVRRIVTTTDDEPTYRVMQQLRGARLGLAAVVDRKNNFRGIVAMEDLIRRLVSAGKYA